MSQIITTMVWFAVAGRPAISNAVCSAAPEETPAGIAAGRFHNCHAGPENAAPLGVFDERTPRRSLRLPAGLRISITAATFLRFPT